MSKNFYLSINIMISKYNLNRLYKLGVFSILLYFIVIYQLDITNKQTMNLLLSVLVAFMLVEQVM